MPSDDKFSTPPSSSSSSNDDTDDEYIDPYHTRGIDATKNKDQKYESEELEPNEEAGKNSECRNRKNDRHSCPVCPKKFRFPNKLREHMRTHDSQRYKCRECEPSLSFGTFSELKTHQKDKHSQASHKCPQCHYTNKKPVFVRRHIEQNHINGVPCTVAGCYMKVAKNRLKTHIKEMHSSEQMPPKLLRAKFTLQKCSICGYESNESTFGAEERHEDLIRHIELFHGKKKQIACSLGCDTLLILKDIEKHLATCLNRSPDEPSTSQSNLPLSDNEYEDTNTVTSQSVLSLTSTEYPGRGSDSVTTAENADDLDLDEEEPPRKIVKYEPENQLRTQFKCELCSKTFTIRDNLRKHVRIYHSDNKVVKTKTGNPKEKHRCDKNAINGAGEVCGKSFRTEQALQDHFNVHDGVKPYACLSCNQRFHGRDRFAVHLSKYHLTSIKDLNANEALFGIRLCKDVKASDCAVNSHASI